MILGSGVVFGGGRVVVWIQSPNPPVSSPSPDRHITQSNSTQNQTKKQKLEVDTKHFKGNFPESCLVEGALLPPAMGSKELMDAQVRACVRTSMDGCVGLLPKRSCGIDHDHLRI